MRAFSASILGIGTAVAILTASPAIADRKPSPEERTRIEAELQKLGYTSWEEIEWDDDGYWKIEDALSAYGKKFDLHLAPDTWKVLKEDCK